MKVKHVHQGIPSTWKVTFEHDKGNLKRNRFEGELAFRITTCISMLKKYVGEIERSGVEPKKIHIYNHWADKLNHLLRDYRMWYHHNNKKK